MGVQSNMQGEAVSPGRVQKPASPIYLDTYGHPNTSHEKGLLHKYSGPKPAPPSPMTAPMKCVPGSIVIVGEALIDFIPCEADVPRAEGVSQTVGAYYPACGGAPFNVSLAVGRLGGG